MRKSQGAGLTHWVALHIQQPVQARVATARAAVLRWLALADHDVILVLELASTVREDVFCDVLPHSWPLGPLKRGLKAILQVAAQAQEVCKPSEGPCLALHSSTAKSNKFCSNAGFRMYLLYVLKDLLPRHSDSERIHTACISKQLPEVQGPSRSPYH